MVSPLLRSGVVIYSQCLLFTRYLAGVIVCLNERFRPPLCQEALGGQQAKTKYTPDPSNNPRVGDRHRAKGTRAYNSKNSSVRRLGVGSIS